MDALAQLALMAKAKLVFESADTFLSFPVLSPLSYPVDRLKFAGPGELTPQRLSDLSEFARITNRVPRGVIAPVDDSEHLWDVYRDVLDQADLATGQATPDEQARYNAAVMLLYRDPVAGRREDSDAFAVYKQHRDAHIKAQEEYRNRQLTGESTDDPAVKAKWAEDEPKLRAALEEVMAAWLGEGRKAEIEAAQQAEEAYASRVPSVMWDEWRTSFIDDIDLATDINQIRYALTVFSPYDLFDRGPWPCFNLTGEEMTRLAGDAPEDLVRVLGSPAASDVETVSFEYRSVGLVRPWFRSALLRSRFWRLGPGGGELSDGGTPFPAGRCPAYVSGLVFARNITVRRRSAGRPDAPPFQPEPPSPFPLALAPNIVERLTELAGGHERTALLLKPTPMMRMPARELGAALASERVPSDTVVDGPAGTLTPALAKALSAGQLSRIAFRARDLDVNMPPMRLVTAGGTAPVATSGASPDTGSSEITILAFICTRLPRCPDPDPTLSW